MVIDGYSEAMILDLRTYPCGALKNRKKKNHCEVLRTDL